MILDCKGKDGQMWGWLVSQQTASVLNTVLWWERNAGTALSFSVGLSDWVYLFSCKLLCSQWNTRRYVCKNWKFCKSVHHYTIQINPQLDATISPVYYPDIYLQAFSCQPLSCGVSLIIPGLTMWDLWWTKWHWDRFFSEYLRLYLPSSFYQFSILFFIYIRHQKYKLVNSR